MSRTIHKKRDIWRLAAEQNLDLDETDDYVLAEGGVVSVTDSRKDGEHVCIAVYPESESSAMFSITADEALSLGQWLVKTFGVKP